MSIVIMVAQEIDAGKRYAVADRRADDDRGSFRGKADIPT
jgi:hypothetical protein